MASTEWLLIGGPADGKKVSTADGRTILLICCDGKDYEYQGRNFLYLGRVYRIGVVDDNDAETYAAARMIDETGLRPIGGA